MRLRTYIVTIAWGLVFSGLHIQPLFVNYSAYDGQVCAVNEKPTCAKSKKCSSDSPVEEKEDCGTDGCNPFLPCMGSCCYLPESFFTHSMPGFAIKEKMALVNDNRILSNFSECWHPPEIVSWTLVKLIYHFLILKNEENIFRDAGYCPCSIHE